MSRANFIRNLIFGATGVVLLVVINGCVPLEPNAAPSNDYDYYYDDDSDIPEVTFYGQPELVVIPNTYIYVVPDTDYDIFFYDGWWWRTWNGRWYRSYNHSSNWRYYRSVPHFYRDVPRNWRSEYKSRHWKSHKWENNPRDYKRREHNREIIEKRNKYDRDEHKRSRDERRDNNIKLEREYKEQRRIEERQKSIESVHPVYKKRKDEILEQEEQPNQSDQNLNPKKRYQKEKEINWHR
ncbi:MAG: hypothetical protein HQK68_11300 [Desulfamplus sp.]|nr:hypothetical protein [Desulfamplus sp.]